VLDIDPTTSPPTMTSFDAQFQYAVFHNSSNKFWQISHFEGPIAKANILPIGTGSVGVAGAVNKTADAVDFLSPTKNMPVAGGAFTIRLSEARALEAVRVQVGNADTGYSLWKTAQKVGTEWQMQWNEATPGNYTIRAEGQELKGKRTKAKAVTFKIT
jgi:hypothetical protein